MLRLLELYFQNEKYKVYSHPVPQTEDCEPLKVLISGASCKSAESLSYGIIKGTTFGTNQPIILSLFELPGKHFQYAVALACELSISGFGLLKDVIPTDDPETAFKDADVAILLNPEYTEKSNREKLNYYFRLYKNLGISLDKYSKKTVKVVLAGEMRVECSMICSQFAESIPVENITGLSRHIATRAYNTIAANLKPEFRNIYGIHVWGMNRPDIASATVDELIDSPIPETRFFKNIGNQTINMYTAVKDHTAHEKDLSEGVQTLKWIKYAITKDTQFYRKCNDNWIGSAICLHLKDWWNGTEHPVSMIVCSDGSHNIPKGLFVSFPVNIERNKTWKIVQDVKIDTHTSVELKNDIKYLNFIRAQIKIYMYKEEIKLLIEKRLQDNEIIDIYDKYPICASLKK